MARSALVTRLLAASRINNNPSHVAAGKLYRTATGASYHRSAVQDNNSITRPTLPKHENFGKLMQVGFVRRWASNAVATAADTKISIGPKKTEDGVEGQETGVVYYGPISSTIKKVKLLSLSTCCLSVSLGPVLTFLTLPETSVKIKGTVSFIMIFLSASTTAALHWFVSPYVHKLKWQPGSDSFDAETLSWLATHAKQTVSFVDVKKANTNRPFVTFEALGKYYFVDEEHCRNKDLMARLTPK